MNAEAVAQLVQVHIYDQAYHTHIWSPLLPFMFVPPTPCFILVGQVRPIIWGAERCGQNRLEGRALRLEQARGPSSAAREGERGTKMKGGGGQEIQSLVIYSQIYRMHGVYIYLQIYQISRALRDTNVHVHTPNFRLNKKDVYILLRLYHFLIEELKHWNFPRDDHLDPPPHQNGAKIFA